MANRKVDALASYIYGRYTIWKADRNELERMKWRTWYRTWRVAEDSQDKERNSERSQIKIPATKEAINMFLDAAMQIIFASDDFFDVYPRNLQAEPHARTIREYLKYLFQQEGFMSKVEQMLTYMGVYGWVVAKIEPKVDIKKTMLKVQKLSEMGVPTGTYETMLDEKVIFRPQTKLIHPENFYISSTATGVQSDGCDGVIERSIVQKHELRGMANKGIVDQTGVNYLLGKFGDNYGTELVVTDDERERLRHTGVYPTHEGEDKVELLDWWGWIPEKELREAGLGELVGPDGGAEMHIIVGDKNCVLKADENPYLTKERPFVKCDYEPLPNEFYGMGICEVAEGAQRGLDATIRSRIDNKAMSINQMFGINVRRFIGGQNLKTYPGKAFLFDGPPREALQPFVVPDVTGGSYKEAQEFERYVQQATGISRMLGGMPGKTGEQTAHEVQMLVRNASGRIRRIVERFENCVLEPIIRWYYQVIFQTLNAKEIFRVTMDNGAEMLMTITPGDIIGDYDFIPQGSISMANQAKLAKTMQFLAQTANPIDAQTVNRQYLQRKIYEQMGFKDADMVFLQQVPPQQQMMMQQGGPRVGTMPSPGGLGQSPQPGGIPGGQGPVMDFNEPGGGL